jgi:hypothetical protein
VLGRDGKPLRRWPPLAPQSLALAVALGHCPPFDIANSPPDYGRVRWHCARASIRFAGVDPLYGSTSTGAAG